MDELEREIEHLADRISNLGDRLEAVMRPEPPAEQAKGIGLTSIPDSPAAQRLHGLRQGAMRIRQRAESLLYRLEV
jgi:hypothetical protein